MITKSQFVKFALSTSKFELSKESATRKIPPLPLLKAGREFENIVKDLYYGGIDLSNHGKSIEQKGEYCLHAIFNSRNHIFYQATFCTPDGKLSFKADFVIRGIDGSIKIIEAKNTHSIQPRHIIDMGLQYLIIKKLGLCKLVRFYIAKPNLEYTHSGEQIDLVDYVEEIDITFRLRAAQPLVTETLYLLERDGISKEKSRSVIQQNFKKIEVKDFDQIPEALNLYNNTQCTFDSLSFLKKGYAKSSTKRLLKKEDIEIKQFFKRLEGNNMLQFVFISIIQPSKPVFNGMKPYESIPINFTLLTVDFKRRNITRKIVTADATTDTRNYLKEILQNSISPDVPIIYYGANLESFKTALNDDLPHNNCIDFRELFYRHESSYKTNKPPLLRYISKFFVPELDKLPEHYNYTLFDNLVWTELKTLAKNDAYLEKELIEFSTFLDCFRLFVTFLRMKQEYKSN